MLQRTILILLLLTGVCFGESREADWWRQQLRELFWPAEIEVRYKAIRTNAGDQSIIVDSPAVTFLDPSTGDPALLTADRITLWPAGPLDPAKPLAMKAIRLEKATLNLAFDPRPATRPTTKPATQPDLTPIEALLKTLRKVEIDQGRLIFKRSADQRAEVKTINLSAEQNEKQEWSGQAQTDLMPLFPETIWEFTGTLNLRDNPIQLNISLKGDPMKLK